MQDIGLECDERTSFDGDFDNKDGKIMTESTYVVDLLVYILYVLRGSAK